MFLFFIFNVDYLECTWKLPKAPLHVWKEKARDFLLVVLEQDAALQTSSFLVWFCIHVYKKNVAL